MNGKQIKNYLKSKGHATVRVHTGTGKSKWLTAWIPSDKGNPMVLQYSAAPFSLELRQQCLRIVYPNTPELSSRTGNTGNIELYSISMTQAQWAAFGLSQGLEIV